MACITYRTFFSRCLAMVGIQMKWVHRSCKNAVIHPPLPKDTRATMRCFWKIPRQLSNVAAYRDSVLLGYPTAALKPSPGIAIRCFWGIPLRRSNVAGYRDSVLLGYPTAALKRRRVSRFGASGVSHCSFQTSPGMAIRCFWGIPLQRSNVTGYRDSVLLGYMYPTAALKRRRVAWVVKTFCSLANPLPCCRIGQFCL
jgi:hypothetical protein